MSINKLPQRDQAVSHRTMAYGEADVPGLNKALKEEDLEESRNIYNGLPDDSRQPKILDSHIRDLAALFVRNHAHNIFGIHLVHAHFAIPVNTVLLGVNYDTPYCRWARTTKIQTMDLSNVHGHIFVLTDHSFHPYEYQTGPAPNLSRVNSAFLQELANFLRANNLSSFVGLQVIDQNPADMLELVLPQGTVMLDVSNLNGCVPTRQTGWKFEAENGEPRVCQANESHGETGQGHEVYNKGNPHPKLETFPEVVDALVQHQILSIASH